MMIDLEERFDRAWAGEPAHVDVDQRLAVGHRSLRRRRLALAAGVLGVAAVLGGTVLATGLVPDPTGSQVATGAPTPTPVDAGEPSGAKGVEVAQAVADLDRIDELHNAGYTDDGRLVVRPGWVVTGKIDEVYVGTYAQAAVGLEVTNTATLEREWYYLQWGTDGSSTVNLSTPGANLGMTLAAWLPRPDGTRARP